MTYYAAVIYRDMLSTGDLRLSGTSGRAMCGTHTVPTEPGNELVKSVHSLRK
jgi:hypothetical protein